MNEHTNFDGYSHSELRRMVGSMDSGGVMAAADPWRRATVALKQIHNALVTSTGDATTSWEGETSTAFEAKMTTLANQVRYVAAYTNDAALTLEMMSEAIAEAKSTMPEEPSFWSKAADAVGDTASAAMGSDDEDTKTAVTDEKKAQAVAVMNLLATRYRAATNYLKPPPARIDDMVETVSSDSMGTAAFSAMIMGGGVGFASGKSSGSTVLGARSGAPATGQAGVKSPKSVQPSRPTDPGIKGGTANPIPKSPSPTPYGPGTGIDGVTTAPKPGTSSPSSPVISGTGTGGSGTGASSSSGPGGGSTLGGAHIGGTKSGGGQFGDSARGVGGGLGRGAGGASRGGSAFGAGGMQGGGGSAGGLGGGSGLGGGRAGRAGAGAGRMGGGTVGGAAGSGAGGRGAFTEGGSGLGRSRGGQAGGQGAAGQGGGAVHGANQAAKKKDQKDKRRPDYLVEDEETWATGKPSNPNVVD
ncbi:hypothetical protein GCM10020229_77330 [Kitasatospora albolonga]|uniref:WXG100 family type VII secretion target n=1 Tax=Kitasatospora albolonga TaxID=68173 RepID=UPI0031ECC3CE